MGQDPTVAMAKDYERQVEYNGREFKRDMIRRNYGNYFGVHVNADNLSNSEIDQLFDQLYTRFDPTNQYYCRRTLGYQY